MINENDARKPAFCLFFNTKLSANHNKNAKAPTAKIREKSSE